MLNTHLDIAASLSWRRILSDFAGEWVGHITGTNAGRVIIRITTNGAALDGTINVSDRQFGTTRFIFVGTAHDDRCHLKITPHEIPDGVVATPGTVEARIQPDGTMAGIWETRLGTAGKFSAKRRPNEMNRSSDNANSPDHGPRRSAMTPLWVISIFVSLCEVVAGLAVTQADGGIQLTLTVFVVTFPVLVAAAFFAILWRKPYVFYPPTEFGAGTKVSEYVQALAGLSPTQAAERQQQLIGGTSKHSTSIEPSPTEHETPEAEQRSELASQILKFFAFKRMRYSDVSNATTRAVFNIGAYQGFQLFDGVPGISFFGFFHELDPAEIVARVRFLLNNIDLSYSRVREHQLAAERSAAERILDQIQVEVLVPEDSPIDEIQSKIENYRPEKSEVVVKIFPPSFVAGVIEREYRDMGLLPRQ